MKFELIKTMFVKIYIVLGGFIVLIVTANHLGPENRGIVGLSLSIIAFVQTLLYMSLGQMIYSKINDGESSGSVREYFERVITYNLACVPVIITICYLLLSQYDIGSFFLIILCSLTSFLLIVEQQFQSISLALSKNDSVNKIQMLTKTFNFVTSLIFVLVFELSALGVIFSYFFSVLISVGMLYNIIVKNYFSNFVFKFRSFHREVITAMKFHVNAIGQALFNQSPLLIAGMYISLEQVASLEMAVKFIAVFFVVGQAAQQVAMSQIAKVNNKNALRVINKIIIYAGLLLLLGVITAYYLSEVVIGFLLTSDYSEVYPILKSMLIIAIPYSLNMIMISMYLKLKFFYEASRNNLTIGIVCLVCSFLLINKFGAVGFIYTYYITATLMMIIIIYMLYMAKEKIKGEISENSAIV